ncbi:MAG: hypothetical protein GY754_40400 [bacterium]|nr:hypothetical protein [bacterium]
MVRTTVIFFMVLALFSTAPAISSLHAETLTSEGKVELMIGQGINGALLGIALPGIAKKWEWGIPLVPLFTAGGIFSPYLLKNSYGISAPEARMINFSTLFGIGAGINLGLWGNYSLGSYMASIVLADILATTLGTVYVYAKNREFTRGELSMIISGAVWGTVTAVALNGALNNFKRSKSLGAFLLAGQILGLGSGFLLAGTQSWTREKMLTMDLTILGGLGAGYGLAALFTPSPFIRWTCGILGMAAGASVGLYVTRNYDAEPEPSLQNRPGEFYIAFPANVYKF